MITDTGDILIELKTELRGYKSNQIVIIYDEIDEKLNLISGSTKEHIKQAAKETGYEIVNEGSTRIELHKPTVFSIPIYRG